MKKIEIIKKIEDFNPNLVWEIDEEKFYGLIGWNGGDDSFWLNSALEDSKNLLLNELLKELKESQKTRDLLKKVINNSLL